MTQHRTQEERREMTRGALLSAARPLFAEKGYAGALQEEIVGRARVTRGALYHNFEGGKLGLFREVVEEIEVEIDEAMDDAFRGEYERSGDTVEAWMAGNLAYLRMCARADVRRILFSDASAILGWEEWREMDMAHGLPQIREGLATLMEAGVVEDQPVEPLAHFWYGASAGAGMYVAEAEDAEAAIDEMQSTCRRVFDGMLR